MMLIYHSSLLKKEEVMTRIALDADQAAKITNDIVCELKVLANSCQSKNLEGSLENISTCIDLLKIVSAMAESIEGSLQGYVSALSTKNNDSKKEIEANKDTTLGDVQDQQSQESLNSKQAPDVNNLTSVLEAIKSLKEMKDSMAQ